jgi:RimJ/RimL family protein N-acetyltransferase
VPVSRLPPFFIVRGRCQLQARRLHHLGFRNPHHGSVKLSASCCSQGRGLGGAKCVRWLKHAAFRDLHAHRFCLDVKRLNVRAQALYASEGFVEEGVLRESVKLADGYDSLVVM